MNETIVFPTVLIGVKAPPIKCQGIKTKLVPFIGANLAWDASFGGRWIEPFCGSGVVAFNLAPPRALLADTNKHIIALYKAIQAHEVTRSSVRIFLLDEGEKLARSGKEYFYEVRARFNALGSPMDFLFLNRSCFNGLIRFNRKGSFNTPFGHKPERFAPAYITKIANQVQWAEAQMRDKDWEFRVASWDETFKSAEANDFVYMDPPYIGRSTDYFNNWEDHDAQALAGASRLLPCGYALSMWAKNKYRENAHLAESWPDLEMRYIEHFYHLGSTEDLRNSMQEVLAIRKGFAARSDEVLAFSPTPELWESVSAGLEVYA